MLTYFKFMPDPAEGLHGPPGARLKSAKGRGCHHVEIMLSYLDLRWFDYFWKTFCPANQESLIVEAPGLGRLILDDNEPMLKAYINICIFFDMFHFW